MPGEPRCPAGGRRHVGAVPPVKGLITRVVSTAPPRVAEAREAALKEADDATDLAFAAFALNPPDRVPVY